MISFIRKIIREWQFYRARKAMSRKRFHGDVNFSFMRRS